MKNIPRTMTNTKFKIDDHSEVVNMCEAIQGLINDGIAEGIVKGEAKASRVKSAKRHCACPRWVFLSSRLRRRPSFPKTTC